MGRPLDRWHDQPVEHWRAAWRLPALHIFDSVESTNDVALRLAADGCPEGTTVIAEEQTRGRGQRGRSWTAAPGSSILLSMILRPPTPGAETLVSLRLGMAAARAIERGTTLDVGLKWPNDLVVRGRKVGGLLCEGRYDPGRGSCIVAGIGLNVTQTPPEWPPDLRETAASLQECVASTIDRARLAGRLVAAWLDAARHHNPRLAPTELAEFQQRDVLLGRPITVNDRPAGIARGIDPDGALRAGEPDAPRRIIAGTVRTPDQAAGGTP
jgi:BirA family transcriptional regulator, biotin operon repressor / biotin---[acetyl-CoA-carboxylase] ligase